VESLLFRRVSPGEAGHAGRGWPEALEAALASLREGWGSAFEQDGRDCVRPLPFEEVFAPMASWAMGRVASRLASRNGDASHLGRFASAPKMALARSLLRRLSAMGALALLEAFDGRRAAGPQLLARFLDGEPWSFGTREGDHRSLYLAFIDDMAGGGFIRFLDDHPVLAQLLGHELESFCNRTVEFVERLDTDLPALRRALGWVADPGKVIALRPSLSDPHCGGRSVAMLAFESGAAGVYKPRALHLDAAFHAFHRCCDPEAPAPAFLLRPDHGWMEVVEAEPPVDPEDRRRLDRSAGRLLALLHVLGATDCHFENLIARRGNFVLIDAETVLHPQLAFADAQHAALGDPQPWDSVARPGLLPCWTFDSSGHVAFDVSALGASGKTRGDVAIPRWRNVNTDAMTFGREPSPPVVAEPTETDIDALADGFASMYRILLARRAELRASAAFRALGEASGRLVLRSTKLYDDLLQASLDPEALRDFEVRDARLGILRPLTDADAPVWTAVRAAELRALERMDVPRFTVAARGDILEPGDGTSIRLQGLRPGFEEAALRFDRLCERDLARQIAVIRGIFQATRTRSADPTTDFAPIPRSTTAAPAATERMMDAALVLADTLVASALHDADGAASWLDLRYHERADCHTLQRAGFSLYDGNAGIALFLGAAAALSGRAGLRDVALRALEPIRRIADRPQDHPHARVVGIGTGTGVGSLVYALTRCAHFLGDSTLLPDALRTANAISDAAIAADTVADALGGSAGAVLGLLALHDSTGREDVLARAIAAGRRLVAQAPPTPRLTGLSHGAAGVALALCRLARASGSDAFRRAGIEALEFERRVFDARASNWPDYRFLCKDGTAPCSTMWCHGAAGIGLGRLALLDVEDDPELNAEIEAAIAATIAYGLRSADHLCCGNFGRIDLLVEAGRRLRQPDLRRSAEATALVLLDARQRTGGFLLGSDDAPPGLKPSLFRGVAGVGYELLRLTAPEDVPTVLTWN
jgi:type 2 lantibiotic biosynthesis protein LanM